MDQRKHTQPHFSNDLVFPDIANVGKPAVLTAVRVIPQQKIFFIFLIELDSLPVRKEKSFGPRAAKPVPDSHTISRL